MLTLTCALCEKKSTYATEELCGRYFMCKHCHWLNLMQINRPQQVPIETPHALLPSPLEAGVSSATPTAKNLRAT